MGIFATLLLALLHCVTFAGVWGAGTAASQRELGQSQPHLCPPQSISILYLLVLFVTLLFYLFTIFKCPTFFSITVNTCAHVLLTNPKLKLSNTKHFATLEQ